MRPIFKAATPEQIANRTIVGVDLYGLSPLQKINFRRIIDEIRRIGHQYIFEINNEYLRKQITLVLDGYLDRYTGGDIFTEYKIVCDKTNNTPDVIDNNNLKINVYLKPRQAAEYINVNITLGCM